MMAGVTREARKTARKALGKLRDLTIAPKTRVRYDKAIKAFFHWSELCGIDAFGNNAAVVDCVEEYIEMCWQEGEARATACDCLSGLQFFVPDMRGRLLGAWRLCKAWQRQELPVRALPLALSMVQAMAMLRVRKGQWRTAAAYLVAFAVFLRTSEILGLRKQDVVLDRGSANTAVLHLGYTKSGKRRGEPESVVLRNSEAVLALGFALEGLDPGDCLVNATPAVFRKQFAEDVRRLGLSSEKYKPYSLRRGGATHQFRSGGTMAEIAEVGRWTHLGTCRVYVNDAVGEVTQVTLPKAVGRTIGALQQELEGLLAA